MSGLCFAAAVPNQAFEQAVRRGTHRAAAGIGADIKRLRQDAGITRSALARAAGLDVSYVRRIEEGEVEPSIEAGARLAVALGADLAMRAYPTTGSPIRDRHQAPIEEALLRIAHARWQRFAEIGVRNPARGWIDLGFHDPSEHVFVATEIESGLRRLEQQIRWHLDKSASLPSWEGWLHLGPSPTVSTLLVVRDTRTNRQIAREFRRLLRTAYPADPRDALESLASGTVAWPGSALLWAVRDRRDRGDDRQGGEDRSTYRIVARP